MRAEDFLQSALDALKNRAAIRDQDSERSMARAVKIYNAMSRIPIDEADGWRLMVALKLARSMQGSFHADDYIDMAGYAALLGECVEMEQ